VFVGVINRRYHRAVFSGRKTRLNALIVARAMDTPASPRILIADDVIIYGWRTANTPCDPKTDPKLNDEDFILEENVAPARTRASVEIFPPHVVVARFFTQPSPE